MIALDRTEFPAIEVNDGVLSCAQLVEKLLLDALGYESLGIYEYK